MAVVEVALAAGGDANAQSQLSDMDATAGPRFGTRREGTSIITCNGRSTRRCCMFRAGAVNALAGTSCARCGARPARCFRVRYTSFTCLRSARPSRPGRTILPRNRHDNNKVEDGQAG